ncbi:hypothetical protein ES705_14159 [subsurface metagenome]
MMETFGEYIKSIRIKNDFTLRKFCQELKLDPSNWSKIERGINPPPKSSKLLGEIADLFGYDEESEVYKALCDLAALAHIPNELITNKELLEVLPVFFRTSRGEKPTEEELKRLVEIIKNK